MIGIYKITSPSGRIYIGQSNNVKRRINSYKTSYLRGRINQPLLFRSFNKYGYDEHLFEVIEKCNIEHLNDRERYWQEYYDVLNGGLNCALVNTMDKKLVHSNKTRLKISIGNKGKKLSKSHIEAIVKSIKGRKLSKYHLKKLNDGYLKHVMTQEHKDIISLSNANRIVSITTRFKMSDSGKGKVFSDSHKDNISKSLKGRKRPYEVMERGAKKRRKVILDSFTGVFYFGAREISELLDINISIAYYKIKNNQRFIT